MMFKYVLASASVIAVGASPLMACLVDGKIVGCDTPFIGCHAKASSWTGSDLERPVPQLVLADEEPAPDTVIVHVFNNDYSINPEGFDIVDAEITPGTTVRWVGDRGIHDITSASDSPESFASESKFSPFVFEYTFNNPGVFNYYCIVHAAQNMAGVITVIPEPGTIGLAVMAGIGLKRQRR